MAMWTASAALSHPHAVPGQRGTFAYFVTEYAEGSRADSLGEHSRLK
jgi:hypothetical protein